MSLPKTVSLKSGNTYHEVLGALTEGIEKRLVNVRELSEKGESVTLIEMKRILQNIVDDISYSEVRGHVFIPETVNASYNGRYFTFERMDNTVRMNDLLLHVNSFSTFKFFISESFWIDLYFYKPDGTYVTMVLVP